MHHVTVERWSRLSSMLHARDARVKFLVLLAYLIALATTTRITSPAAVGYSAAVLITIVLGRLPIAGVLLRAAVVLPFAGIFALFTALAGDEARALALVVRSYLSAAAVLVLIGTTPMPALLRGLEWLKAPSFLILVIQFLYRYLFVISEQAQHMRLAVATRSPQSKGSGLRFRAAAGAVAVLFARSHARAEGIHRAMLARGFNGHLVSLSPDAFTWADPLFLMGGIGLCVALRLILGAG